MNQRSTLHQTTGSRLRGEKKAVKTDNLDRTSGLDKNSCTVALLVKGLVRIYSSKGTKKTS